MKSQFLAVAHVLPIVVLSACTSGTNAIVETLQSVVPPKSQVASARLNPQFRYLRVTIGGRVALLVLGYVDRHPQGPIEVWYSAQREVLRLQGGRVVGVTGLPTEWRGVSVPELPPWSEVADAKSPVSWTRVRDVMPGYKFGVRDALLLRAIPPPAMSALQDIDPTRLTWFEERFAHAWPDGASLPPARYAVDLRGGGQTAVYGEQCIVSELCFTWQRWPAESQSSSGR